MIIYSLLFLFCGGNVEIAAIRCETKSEAVEAFRARVPTLDDSGYVKTPDNIHAWCVAEQYDPFL